MEYPTYLIHYNKNHSKANGQFVSGDGDGDGISNDHNNQKKQLTSAEKKARVKAGIIITAASLTAAAAVGAAYCISERNEKIRHEQNQQRTREWIEKVNQVKWREAASKAKSIGGDW